MKYFIITIFLLTSSIHVISQTREELAKNPKLFLELAIKSLKWNEPAEPIKIVGPIYFVGTQGLASWLITTTEGHILLNTGMPPSAPMIESSIRTLGFKPEDIKYILTCHAHTDHVGGHAYLKKISGAKVAMMEEEIDLVESGGKLDFHYGKNPEFYFEPVKVDLPLADGDVIKLGDVAMTARRTAGHTKGGTTWVMNVVDNGKIYTVVFPDGTSINPGYQVARNPSYPKINDDFRNTLHILEMIKPDIWLCSHTDMFNFNDKRNRSVREGVRAWVDPEGYRQFVAAQRSKFEAQVNDELGVAEK